MNFFLIFDFLRTIFVKNLDNLLIKTLILKKLSLGFVEFLFKLMK